MSNPNRTPNRTATATPTPTATPAVDPTAAKAALEAAKAEEAAAAAAAKAAREKTAAAKEALRSVGTTGFSGRGPSIYEALRSIAASGKSTVALAEVTRLSEEAYRLANVDRKISANGAKVYSGYTLEVYRLAGLLDFDPTAKVYRLAPAFLDRLRSKPTLR